MVYLVLCYLHSGQPPDNLLRDAKNTTKFFKHVGSIYRLEHEETTEEVTSAYRVLTEEEFEAVSSVNKYLPLNSSHFHKVPMSYGSSYGSLGSHGSYNENTGLGSSYGSYGDINNMHAYNSPVGPCGFNMHVQVGGPFLGSSPDARHRSQLSHGTGFGVSPFGGLGPMSLGASPSQFTPPSSQMQISSASPGKYGPTSPVRGRGISLGKAAAVGQYNKRTWGYPTMCMQPYGSADHGPGFCGDGMSCSQPDAQFRGHGGSPHSAISSSSHSNWWQQMGGGNGLSSSLNSANQKSYPVPQAQNSFVVSSHNLEVPCDKPEGSSSLPDPADWDPNYR
ncbi:hypothetical protein BHE74_00004666 [Ensete ventricosum]|nr:hypothetical protein GW17_00005541 [Ensete ventricosum]RWW86555.1 hypothetical protein BHE74_00004666 [Ensete ventricosum]RZR82334.1 hypothetical protein BHM03_00008722 [Ensete ventricosum]